MALGPSRLCHFHMTLAAFCAHALVNVPIVPARTLKVLGKVREHATQLGTVPDSFLQKEYREHEVK